jgi:hypothetical protein
MTKQENFKTAAISQLYGIKKVFIGHLKLLKTLINIQKCRLQKK